MNYIVECKNKDNLQPNNPNGVYNTLIQDKVMLEEGDTIVMKSAFIDTEAQSQQKIIVPEDTTCTLTFINYIMNTFGIGHMVSDSFSNFGGSVKDAEINDGLLYIMCKKSPANPNFRHLGDIKFAQFQVEGAQAGNFMSFVKYTDLNGQQQTDQVQIPPIGDDPVTVSYNVLYDISQSISIHCGTADGFQIAYSNMPITQQPKYGNTIIAGLENPQTLFPSSFSTIVGSNAYEAIKSTVTIKIPQANYDPNDLCDVINRQLNQNGSTIDTSNFTDNPFLQTVTPTDDIFFVNGGNNPDNISPDYRYQYKNATDGNVPGSTAIAGVFVGASDLTLSFEPNTEKFFWEYLHSPYYKANAEVVGYQNFTANDGSTFLGTIDRHGGICFTNLTSADTETGKANNFWTKIMGFQLDRDKPNCLYVSYASQLNYTTPAPTLYANREQVHKPTFVNNQEPQVGINATGNFQGLATAVETKSITLATSGNPSSGFPYAPILGAAGNPTNAFLSTSSKTVGVEAVDGVLAGTERVTFGYYLIEVEAQFQNNYITADQNRRNVMGIVSRYYVKDSYTSGGEDASVIYTHQGEPQMLSSFNIRILDSDKSVAQNIGTDNTVHLLIVKAPKKIK